MARTKGGKREALARDGALNPHPEAVRDALFADNPFFDPADLVQVRYEMVRRHEVDGQAIGEVAAKFGVSRPTFYKAQGALATTGLTGLLPAQRGPKGGHKLSDEMLAFDADLRTRTPGMTMAERLAAIEQRFGIKVHRRSLERAVARKKNDARRPVHRRRPAGRRLRGPAGGRLERALEWPGRPRDPHSPRARGMDRRVEAGGASRNTIRGLSAHTFGHCGISPERAHPCSRRNHRRSDDGGRSCTQLR